MFRLLLTIALFGNAAVFGQVFTGPPTCTTQIGAPPLIRAEGRAEKVADVIIACSGGTSGSDASITVTVTLNTAVTSRVLSPASSLAEAVLLVDELATAPQAGTNVIQAAVGGNQAVFNNVPIHLGRGTTYRIANLRADARSAPGNTIQATIVLSGVPLQGQTLALGLKSQGLNFAIQAADGTPAQSLSFSPGGGNALTHRLKFAEGFAGSFRKRNTATSLATPTVLSDQNVPATDYHTESGFYLSTLPPGNGLNEAGLATQGTRLVARFYNIPAGVTLYVTTRALPGTGASSAVLVAADSFGAGAYSAAAQTGTVIFGGAPVGIAPVTLAGASGAATWEVLDADPVALESYSFGLVVVSASAGTAIVVGEIGPVSDVNIASSTEPVPRFADTSMEVSVCAASPCPTATPGGIAITYQTGTAAPAPDQFRRGKHGGRNTLHRRRGRQPRRLAFRLAFERHNARDAASHHQSGEPFPGRLRRQHYLTSGTQSTAVRVLATVSLGPSGPPPLGCTANVANPTQLRDTGMTELLGDITIFCTGGTPTLRWVKRPDC